MATYHGNTTPAGPVWRKIQTADFVSLTAYKDVNAIMNGDIAVNDATGEITLSADSHIAIYDGPAEGASFRTKLATAAYGWRGDGTQQIQVRLRPTSNPGVLTKPGIMVGLVDQDGDVTDATPAQVTAGGFRFANATAMYICTSAAPTTTSEPGGSLTYAGNTPRFLVSLCPSGLVGDDTNGAGAREGALRCAESSGINAADFNGQAMLFVGSATPCNDAVYGELFVGFGAAGGADDVATTLTFIMEWCIVQVLPTNEWVI